MRISTKRKYKKKNQTKILAQNKITKMKIQ